MHRHELYTERGRRRWRQSGDIERRVHHHWGGKQTNRKEMYCRGRRGSCQHQTQINYWSILFDFHWPQWSTSPAGFFFFFFLWTFVSLNYAQTPCLLVCEVISINNKQEHLTFRLIHQAYQINISFLFFFLTWNSLCKHIQSSRLLQISIYTHLVPSSAVILITSGAARDRAFIMLLVSVSLENSQSHCRF